MKKRLLALAIASIALCSCGSTPPETPEAQPPTPQGPTSYNIVIDYYENKSSFFDSVEETVDAGESFTLNLPNHDFQRVVNLLVNGVDKRSEMVGDSLTLTNITRDTNIKVYYALAIPYVSTEQAPIIDGNIDDVYNNATTYTTSHYEDNLIPAHPDAEIQVMWNETGLYFMGLIYDEDVNALDRCNLWVSETYKPNTSESDDYSAYPSDGNYAVCINTEGQNLLYTALDITPYWQRAVQKVTGGYFVEVYMPVIGTKPLQAGNSIGLDFSVDYYSSSSTSRQYYSYWMGLGAYWSNVGALAQVLLLAP